MADSRSGASSSGKGPTKQPAHLRVSTELRRRIAAGDYPGGVPLPTEARLAEHHGVSRHTVRRAFQDLVAEGAVHRIPGRGTFAAPSGERYLRQLGSIEDLMSLSADTEMEVVRPLEKRVDVGAAGRLGLDTDLVDTVTFRRLHDGVPFVLTTAWLAPGAAESVRGDRRLQAGAVGAHTIIGLLEPHLPDPIVEAAQSITVDSASARAAEALGCEPGHPVLRTDRLYSDARGRAVELAVSRFLPERYTYRVTLRRSGH